MTETETEHPKRNWVGLFVTTVLGIAATVAVGSYQLFQAEKQTIRAEEERARAVRQNLVSIVEEHVLNEKPIDFPRLARLIDQRRREERVTTPITVAELLENAEFNILGSRYLAFEKKQAIKVVFDKLYADLSTRSFAQYSSAIPNADLLNTLARQIQDGKSSEALQTLKRLQEAHAKDLQQPRSSLNSRGAPIQEKLAELLKDPWPLLLTFVIYVALLYWMVMHRPEILRVVRVFFGGRPSLTEARERIRNYQANGMPENLIVDRLWQLGIPRSWTFDELSKSNANSYEEVPLRDRSE